MDKLFDFIDQRNIIRRVVLFITMYMTWAAFDWAATFAETTTKTGLEVPGIIAAVTAPITLLQGFVFKVYAEGRNK